MISNKREYRYYMECDRVALRKETKYPRLIGGFVEQSITNSVINCCTFFRNLCFIIIVW